MIDIYQPGKIVMSNPIYTMTMDGSMIGGYVIIGLLILGALCCLVALMASHGR